ncbi:MAG TPA: NAD(P)-dependent oxidoreductase [Candidatus Paceibacterota bacterium]|nr:NAD(P)-dependent oxidoreductase [Candidatus Paceibacterota bacterium]
MIDLERVLVIGGSGMVGSQIDFGIKPSHAELDITDPISVQRGFAAHRPSVVLLLAGIIDVKKAEHDPAVAERVNVKGAAHVADACARANIPLVYYSSCMVFDGTKPSPYVESDVPHPLTVYGKTKSAGETEVLSRSPGSLVIRTGWLFGGFERDVKFVHRFHDALVAGESIRATNDRFGSPTYVPDLIAATVSLMHAGVSGIMHVVNSGVVSYFTVAEEIKKLTGASAEVIGITQRELDPRSEPRGAMEGLASERGMQLRPYEEALAEYIHALAKR